MGPSLCSSPSQQITKRRTWARWLTWPLPLATVTFAKAGRGETLRQPFITKRCASSSPHLFFIFATWPPSPPRSQASGMCAGGAWANVKWTIKKRSERGHIPPTRSSVSQCQPGASFAYIRWSEPRRRRWWTFIFFETYAALQTHATFIF